METTTNGIIQVGGAAPGGAFPDFSRTAEHVDAAITAAAEITCIGCGGAATLIMNLARCGVAKFILIDPDVVSATNIATQNYFADQIGMPKPVALAANIRRINPHAEIETYCLRYEDLLRVEREALWQCSDIVLAMTDSHTVQMAINRDALAFDKPAIFAMMGIGLQQMEVTATFPEVVASGGGCHACHAWPRVKAYRDDGFKNPDVIGSHAVSADMLNAQLAYLVLARLHAQAGSDRRVRRLADQFATAPCLLTQLDPGFWPQQPEVYGSVTPAMQLFTTRTFGLDSPKGWVCEACGTAGVA